MRRRILIVEDNALVREMYRSALKPLDADLIETQRGGTAHDIALREHPDLVILDLMLPDIAGMEVARRLKSTPETARIPILAVTNAAAATQADALKSKGFVGLVTKPVNIGNFCATVSGFLPRAEAG